MLKAIGYRFGGQGLRPTPVTFVRFLSPKDGAPWNDIILHSQDSCRTGSERHPKPFTEVDRKAAVRSLEGTVKKVLITGAARGIGLATARQFAAAGWRVLSLDKEFGAEVVGERVKFDLRLISEIPALIAAVGELDTLVNNAGVLYCDPIDAIPEAHRSEILAGQC